MFIIIFEEKLQFFITLKQVQNRLFSMIKKVLLVFAMLLTTLITAQTTKKFTINWKDITIGTSGSTKIQIPGFDEANFDFDEENRVSYTTFWEESKPINSNTAKVINVVYKEISKQELKGLKTSTIPSKLNFEAYTITSRGKNKGYLKFFPILKEGNTFKKVTEFTVSYETTRSYASKTNKIATSSSVLASGDWFKFEISETGVYKLTPEFLQGLGINVSEVDPSTIKIYGTGGRMLPLRNSENNFFDLQENAIQLVGGEDGAFSGNDYILFYGIGSEGYTAESETNLNLYQDETYYFVTYGGLPGRRIGNYTEPADPATVFINSFTDYQFYEVDEENLVKVGRRWFGDRFDITSSRAYRFNFPNLITTEPLELKVLGAAISGSPSTLNVTFNNQPVASLNFSAITSTTLASGKEISEDVISNTDQIAVQLDYINNGNPEAVGYLDYVSVKGQRGLIGTGNQMEFYYEDAATLDGIGQYTISNASSISQVWDVTDTDGIVSISNPSSQNTLSFKAGMGEVRKYVALVENDYLQPLNTQNSRVSNQNLKGEIFLNEQGQFQDLDYLMITNQTLLSQANRLAEFHRSTNGYHIKVVTLDHIYNEFSNGKRDIGAIRNFVRYIYENASTPESRLKYLCLFGDGSVDYKDRLQGNNNMVPTFESLPSFSLITSFASDDFYGCMDPIEGTMSGGDQLDIAVGRILADTPLLAETMVTKIIDYNSRKSFGRWRNTMMLVADDVDVNWEETIQRNLNELGDELVARKPFINLNKVFADSYQQESSAAGNRYPQVNKAISTGIENGAIVLNYFGHGGEDGLAKEFIVTKSDINGLSNTNKYPLIITVTCEYTKFDNPLRPTVGELTFWNANGGAIALVTTTREVIVTFGISVNDRLTGFLFPDGDEYPSVAEALRQLKNTYTTNSRRVVFYFGDPAMKLPIPKPEVKLTRINDVPIDQPVDTLKALSRIKISGEVVDPSGNLINNYNGVLSTTIYDKEIQRTTLANDFVTNSSGEIIKLDYNTLGSIVFRGQASVINGLFDVEFVVPRDIAIPVGNGKVSFYSSRNDVLEDQTGVDQRVLIGGVNENAPEDNTGPQIQLFMNDESFISGGVTNNAPVLIAKLQDENGINTASGIGHDISAILDGDDANPFILNEFYETELDDFTKGVVNFKFSDLEPGLHTLTFKGWDVYNNSSTQEIQFVVSDDSGLRLTNVLNYPNPFVSNTEFWFEHSGGVNDILEVQVQVFTVSGKVVWTMNQTVTGRTSYTDEIQWNGRDDFGDRLGKGVYVYKISVKSTLTNQRVEKFEKLVIL